MVFTLNVVHGFLSSVLSTESEKYSENGVKCRFSKFAIEVELAYSSELILIKDQESMAGWWKIVCASMHMQYLVYRQDKSCLRLSH